MATKYETFKSQVNGKGYDIDGRHGAQCWDGYAKYCQYLGNTYNHCTLTGGAKDLIKLGSPNCTKIAVSSRKAGDIAVWERAPGTSPGEAGYIYGHVAICDGGDRYLGQNQKGIPYPGGGANFNIITLDVPTTILRPKNLTNFFNYKVTFAKGILVKSEKL